MQLIDHDLPLALPQNISQLPRSGNGCIEVSGHLRHLLETGYPCNWNFYKIYTDVATHLNGTLPGFSGAVT
jgi:hypothetical protein